MSVPEHVGVLGGGTMGAGIAHAFLASGSTVVVVERDDAAVEAARGRLDASLAKAAEKVGLDAVAASSRLSFSTSYSSFAPVDLVVEAVPEDMALKVAALTAVEEQLASSAWLATNTSSLSITGIAAKLARPERFCGLHFFNPVPQSALVEVVLAPKTSAELAELAQDWVRGLDKAPIVVNDAPGFASSRLGLVIALEAMRMLEEGVASAEDIDTAMVLGYRHATGPLKTTDLVGLDVRLHIAEYLHSTLGDRFAPPQILRDMVARGELGRKSGRGFFSYDS
jgi:3-hydroxybutyryl-CoA dehydrogenase